MEREYVFEVKVMLEADDEEDMRDKRALTFEVIMASMRRMGALGSQVSELSILKPGEVVDEIRN
jgi:hypothetical protein